MALTSLIEDRLDRQARGFLYNAHVTPESFTGPPGETALIGPDSVSWRIFKNPVSLFVGGITAVILEFADPRVRSGVWDHSSFRREPVERMKRTGLAAMVTVYAARSVALDMIAHVNALHEKVTGTTPAGLAYDATDPELLDWVQVTATYGFLEAYSAWVAPLGEADKDRCYAEAVAAGAPYGARNLPTSRAEQRQAFAARKPVFERSDIVFEFLEMTKKAQALPAPANLSQGMLIRAAVELVPGDIREILGLDGKWDLKAWEKPLVRRMGALSDRLVLKSAPPALACRRMGLPEDYLYTR